MNRLVDLSHPIRRGQATHPGLPAPVWSPFRTREEYRRSSGTEFQVDRVQMVGNTGTYLDSPFHRFPDGGDLASLPLTSVADLPVVVVRVHARRSVDAEALDRRLGGLPLEKHAILLHTGGDAGWGTPAYAESAPYVTADGADWLAARRPVLVGIDAVNIDDLDDSTRPAHTRLLGDGVLILEHLTGLAEVPARGARLHAAPPAWHEMGTWPVRAYALVPDPVA
jgi:kynurenine formamidase